MIVTNPLFSPGAPYVYSSQSQNAMGAAAAAAGAPTQSYQEEKHQKAWNDPPLIQDRKASKVPSSTGVCVIVL